MSSTSLLKKVQASVSMILGVFVLSSASVSAFAATTAKCSTNGSVQPCLASAPAPATATPTPPSQ